jgi:hypothetical protein
MARSRYYRAICLERLSTTPPLRAETRRGHLLNANPEPMWAMSHLYVPVIDNPASEQSAADNQVIVQGEHRRRFVPSVAAPPRGQRSLQVGEH